MMGNTHNYYCDKVSYRKATVLVFLVYIDEQSTYTLLHDICVTCSYVYYMVSNILGARLKFRL